MILTNLMAAILATLILLSLGRLTHKIKNIPLADEVLLNPVTFKLTQLSI